MKMELRDMEYFAVVADRGNVGRAAEELGLSQPALSKSLRRLERSVGAKLVKRTPKGVDLTAVGSALFARARGLRLSLDDIAREAADLSQGRAGHLRIGSGTRYAVDLIPAACAALLKEAPRVTMTVSEGTTDMLAPALLRGELDLIVTAGIDLPGYDDLVGEQLWEDEVVVYASISHRLAGKKTGDPCRTCARTLGPDKDRPVKGASAPSFRAERFASPQGRRGDKRRSAQTQTFAHDRLAELRPKATFPGKGIAGAPDGNPRKRIGRPAKHRSLLPEGRLPLPRRPAVHRDPESNRQRNRERAVNRGS